MTRELLREGSAKDVFRILNSSRETECLQFEFTDRVSVFDRGPIPVAFIGLGKLRCAIAAFLFQEMEKVGFNTHYISHDVENATMNVQPFNVSELDIDFGDVSAGRLLAGEILFRREVTKKFLARVQAGKVDRAAVEALLVDAKQLSVGSRLEPPFVECSTKFEDSDRYLTDEEAVEILGITPKGLQSIYRGDVSRDVEFLTEIFEPAGFDLKDGKFEIGLLKSGKISFLDSISPDELRLVGPDGRSYDKDPVRLWYEKNDPGWIDRLKSAKNRHPYDKSRWPDYERVPPQDVIDVMVNNYRTVAEKVGAV